jgi:hypothetical protein
VKIGIEKPLTIGPATRKMIKAFLDYIQSGPSDSADEKKKESPPKKKGSD